MGQITEPSSFRSVTLQSGVLKTAESLWVQQNIARLEELSGPEQHAYKRGHGVHTALHALHSHINQVTTSKCGGLVYFFDLCKAFGSGNRVRLFHDLQTKFPGDKFISKLKNCYNNLKMQVQLGFTAQADVEVD